MIQVIMTRKVDMQGRIILPKSIRQKLNIQPEDRLLMTLKQDRILIEKEPDQLNEQRMCYVTGIISSECRTFSGGIQLSKEAAAALLLEIQSKR